MTEEQPVKEEYAEQLKEKGETGEVHYMCPLADSPLCGTPYVCDFVKYKCKKILLNLPDREP